MKALTKDLTGPALDWAVCVAAGGADAYPKTRSGPAFLKLWKGNSAKYVHPSTDWSQGGPIIERELICTDAGDGSYTPLRKWAAWRADAVPVKAGQGEWYGTTPLSAAMRCFVAFRLGDEVDVPEELLE